jgi:hypothetical protein
MRVVWGTFVLSSIFAVVFEPAKPAHTSWMMYMLAGADSPASIFFGFIALLCAVILILSYAASEDIE